MRFIYLPHLRRLSESKPYLIEVPSVPLTWCQVVVLCQRRSGSYRLYIGNAPTDSGRLGRLIRAQYRSFSAAGLEKCSHILRPGSVHQHDAVTFSKSCPAIVDPLRPACPMVAGPFPSPASKLMSTRLNYYQRQNTNFHESPDGRVGRDSAANIYHFEASAQELRHLGIEAVQPRHKHLDRRCETAEHEEFGTHYELDRPGCAITWRVRNCCTNWLSSMQHIAWVSRSSRERNKTPQSWMSLYCSMVRPRGGDTSRLLVYNGSRTGRDVPNASRGGTTGDCSKVTTQLERSE